MKKLLAATLVVDCRALVAVGAVARADHGRGHLEGADRGRPRSQRGRPVRRHWRPPLVRQRRDQPSPLRRPDVLRAVDGRSAGDQHPQRRRRPGRQGIDERSPGRLHIERLKARPADGCGNGGWFAGDLALDLRRRAEDARRSTAQERRRSRRQFRARVDAGRQAVRGVTQSRRRCRRADRLQDADCRAGRRAIVEAFPRLGCDEPRQPSSLAGGDRSGHRGGECARGGRR